MNFFKLSSYASFSWKFNAEVKSKKCIFKEIKIEWVKAKKVKKKTEFRTSLDFNIFKNGFRNRASTSYQIIAKVRT